MMLMQKEWQIMPKIKNDFIERNKEIDPVVLQLLANRKIAENDMKIFLDSDYEKYFNDPFLFNDMEEAIKLTIDHIKNKSKIIIYGDYDADGVTSSAVLSETLKILKGNIEVYIPDRVSEGYGLNKKAIDYFLKKETKLIITVDGGIRSKEEVLYAQEKGIEVIITDHHVSPEKKSDFPPCLIINPSVKEDKYPFKYLAGVGVAFNFSKAIIEKAKISKAEKQILENRLLDLTAIGIIADCVPLLGENRFLVKKGLEFLNKTKRPGLIELIKVAGINNKIIDSWNIGFQIAPRLNAAGRMDHANTAFCLLNTKNKKEASELAQKLNNKNIKRQKITEEISLEVENQIKNNDNEKITIGICPKGDLSWNEGVVGLVAGRMCEKYYKPSLIITKTKDEYKGSGRSIEEFNLIKAIEECKESLDKYGGHPMACGFSLKEKNLDAFIKKIKKIANEKLDKINLRPKLKIDYEIDIKEINEDLFKNIKSLSPFGQENPQPNFLSRNLIIKDIMTMGTESQHIKFRINGLWALAFYKANDFNIFKIGDKVDMVYYVEKNEFNGRSELQLKIIDIHFSRK